MRGVSLDEKKSTRIDAGQLRLIIRAARLHHVQNYTQNEIAQTLGISQTGVSRLLRLAEESGYVKKTVIIPDGLFPELEENLMSRFNLTSAYIIDVNFSEETISQQLGAAAARLLRNEIKDARILGFTSWSSTLREMAHQIGQIPDSTVEIVAETLGDLGSPRLQHEADVATLKIAEVLGAEPAFLRAPGVFASSDIRKAAEQDINIKATKKYLDNADVVLIGLGPADFHGTLEKNDNFFSDEQLASVRRSGAIGQLHQRFINSKGKPVASHLNDLVIGITLPQVRKARKKIVVAGGEGKHAAMYAALEGNWIDVLVTDFKSASLLLDKKIKDMAENE